MSEYAEHKAWRRRDKDALGVVDAGGGPWHRCREAGVGSTVAWKNILETVRILRGCLGRLEAGRAEQGCRRPERDKQASVGRRQLACR
jgi:hypothetical protein